VLHFASISTAITAVFLSNYISRRGQSRLLYWLQSLLTIAFAYACFREVGWVGLFLSFFSPNVTDILKGTR
jgi:hypothetical protein